MSLLRLVFGESLDSDEQAFGEGPFGPTPDFLWRLNPNVSRFADGFVWIANGRIVGNVTVLPGRVWGRYLVANVAVHPDFRRRGIARALMLKVAELIAARNGRIILLQVVKDNTAAVNLYRTLGYESIGHMATWYAPVSRLRAIAPGESGQVLPNIRPLSGRQWQAAYELDRTCLSPDLSWPDPLRSDAYRRGFLRRLDDFMNGRQMESWAISDRREQLTGLATIWSEWGRAHRLAVRVLPELSAQLERPLLAKAIRRLQYMPRRNVRVDHPDSDAVMEQLLREANFTHQRTLTHMRLDLVKQKGE